VGRAYNGTHAEDILVMKLANADGEISWVTMLDGDAHLDDRGWSIDVGDDGCPVVTGLVTRADGSADYRTAKLDGSDGAEIWSRTVPGAVNNLNERAGWIEIAPNGDAIMANRTWASQTSYDVILQRYATDDGEDVWAVRYGSGPSIGDNPRAMTLDAAGNVLIAGVESGDYQVLHFDGPSGELDWASTYDGPGHGYDMASCILEGPGGAVVVSGFATGELTSWDAVTAGFDPTTGSFLWDVSFDTGDAQVEEGTVMAACPSGDLYVIGYGYTWGSDNDAMILHYELSGPSAVVDDPASARSVEVGPNPFSNRAEIRLDAPASRGARVRILDVTGRQVVERTLARGAAGFDWDGADVSGMPVPAGVYFVTVDGPGRVPGGRKIVRAP
jgi:outer membrane protein assembly factor BamB